MKLSVYVFVVQVLALNFLLASHTKGQKTLSVKEAVVSISLNKASLSDIFGYLESVSDYHFNYNGIDINSSKKLDLDFRNARFADVLLEISKKHQLGFRQLNDVIQVVRFSQIKEDDIVVMIMVDVEISGNITDENGQGLPGASVVVKGTAEGTTSDIGGNYKLSVPEGATITVSFVGYSTQEFIVGNQSVIDVGMEPDAEQLEEVVVIGYGSVKRSDMTGAVSSIGKEDIQNRTSNTIAGILQGKAAGVAVTTGDASPGGGINIRIRGTSSINSSTEPLYIIDGFPVNSSNDDLFVGGGSFESSDLKRVRPNALSIINPNDIESIEILKDAAATTIYGSRGANGVVLIKTKRGQAGKTNIDVNYRAGVQKVIKTYEKPTGSQYAQWDNDGQIAGGNPARYDGSSREFPTPGNASTTDWQDLLYRTASMHDLGVTFSGGTDDAQYLFSGKYFDQEGIMLGSGFKNIQTRLSLDQKFNDFVKVGANFTISHSENDQVPAGNVSNYNIVRAILDQSPVHNPDWINESTGRWWTDPYEIYPTTDPYNYVQVSNKDILTTNRLLANMFVDLKFAKFFNFHATAGVDHADAERDLFYDRTMYLNGGSINNGSASVNRSIVDRMMGNAYFSYNREFGDHSVSSVLGLEAITQTQRRRNMHAENFTSDAQTTYNMGEGLGNITVGTNQSKWQNMGYFGRVNYGFKSKYLFSVNFRYDGASQFGKDNKWAFFPAIAAAWRITDEDFMDVQGLFSNMKLRLSVGKTGNGFIPTYSSLGTWSISGKRYSYNDVAVSGSGLTRLANPALKWESTTQYNLGLDFGFMDERLTFNLDVYSKTTNDLILNVVIPKSSGFGSSIKNVGSLRNKGVELSMNWVVADKDFRYDLSMNAAHNRSVITDLGISDEESDDLFLEVASWERYGGIRLYEGRPAGQLYGYIIDGTFATQAEADAAPDHGGGNNTEGFYKYRDVDGDGVITNDDQTLLGNGQPDFFLGSTHNFAWKKFDLSIFLQGAFGNQIATTYGTDDFSYTVANTWTPSDRNNKKYGVNSAAGNGYRELRIDSHLVHDADYLRVKNITLGYNIPVQNANWVKGIKVYFTGENLFTFSSYPGYNPDVSSGGTAAFGEGFDGGVYPLAKTFVFGVNFKF